MSIRRFQLSLWENITKRDEFAPNRCAIRRTCKTGFVDRLTSYASVRRVYSPMVCEKSKLIRGICISFIYTWFNVVIINARVCVYEIKKTRCSDENSYRIEYIRIAIRFVAKTCQIFETFHLWAMTPIFSINIARSPFIQRTDVNDCSFDECENECHSKEVPTTLRIRIYAWEEWFFNY